MPYGDGIYGDGIYGDVIYGDSGGGAIECTPYNAKHLQKTKEAGFTIFLIPEKTKHIQHLFEPTYSNILVVEHTHHTQKYMQYVTEGTVCWGHQTGVTETNIRQLNGNWTGHGLIQNSGDSERIAMQPGGYMISEFIKTGVGYVSLLENNYASGDIAALYYRGGNTIDNCSIASWNIYATPFEVTGYVQVKVEY